VLSYQHQYHAGNFADVHKHIALVALLRALQAKPAPLCYVDAHAGSGVYDLDSAEARKTGEADAGVCRLWQTGDLPETVNGYVAILRDLNTGSGLRRYPGSPALAAALLRDNDRAILMELHPRELEALRGCFKGDRRIAIHMRDSYEGLPALLPPPVKRGLVLLDPSYEIKSEYDDIAGLLQKAHRRWGNAVYLLWYPLLPEGRHRHLLKRMHDSGMHKILRSELRFPPREHGMYGSGLVIVNPPWRFDNELARAGEFLAQRLAGCDGEHAIDWLVGE
jgi:23S rRNA (adenine2030-N6)-methyltransferase